MVRSELYAADVEAAKAAEYESSKAVDLEKAKRNQEYKSKVVNSLAEIDACETKRARLEDKMLSSLQEAYSAARECISNSDAIYQNMQTAFGYGQSIGEVYPEGYLPLFDNKYKIGQQELSKEQVHDQWQAMRQDGMTYQAIADASGVSDDTVRRAVYANEETQPPTITGKDGKQLPLDGDLTLTAPQFIGWQFLTTTWTLPGQG